MKESNTRTDANRDPITDAVGSHPVGTGLGALAGGAAAGAAAGTVAGPVGTVVGAAVGAVVGGLAGKGIAEAIDPTAEDAYWRDNYSSRPYVDSSATYDDYGPAYAYGVNSYSTYAGRDWDDVEPELSGRWDTARSTASLTRFQASRVACLARSHSSEDWPRTVSQRPDSSGSTSSQSRPA